MSCTTFWSTQELCALLELGEGEDILYPSSMAQGLTKDSKRACGVESVGMVPRI